MHGDVETALWGLDLPRALPGGVRYIWHCAATLHYELHRAERIDSVNHHGARHAIDLARRLGAQLNHMSTAYIAPSRDDGVLVEQPAVEQDAAPATPYHHAKIRAERAVVESEIVWRILRPSFVVGHARTHAATHHAGYYAMARRLTIAARRHLVPEGARAILPVPPDATINLVPVDTVARAAVAVGTLGETGTVYHLANAEPPTSRSVLEALFAWTDLPRPEFGPPGEARLPGPAGALQRYLPFFRVNQLDLDHTRRVTGSSAMATPWPPPICWPTSTATRRPSKQSERDPRSAELTRSVSLPTKLIRGAARVLGRGPLDPRTPLRIQRLSAELAGYVLRPPRDTTVKPEAIGGVPGEWIEPTTAGTGSATILYLHGGGYVLGSPRAYRGLVGHLARSAKVRAFVPHYRRAPEHPFPAAVNDAVAAYRGLLAQGVAADRIAVVGDSAGAALALALTSRLRDGAEPLPAVIAMVCPWLDLTADGPAHRPPSPRNRSSVRRSWNTGQPSTRGAMVMTPLPHRCTAGSVTCPRSSCTRPVTIRWPPTPTALNRRPASRARAWTTSATRDCGTPSTSSPP